MTETIMIDFVELAAAAPKVGDLHRALSEASRRLRGVDVGVDMPPALAARVRAAVDAAAGDTSRAAASIGGLDHRMATCARLAEQANAVGVVKMITGPGFFQLEAIDGFLSGEADRTLEESKAGPKGEPTRLGKAIGWLKMLDRASSFVPFAFADFRNPFLSDQQRVGRFGALAASTYGGERLAGAAGAATRGRLDALVVRKMGANLGEKGTAAALARMAATRAPFLLGGGVGLAVSIGWTALDLKFGISAKVGDAAAHGMQEFDDHVLDPAGDAVAKGAGKVADGAGTVADGLGKAKDGFVDAITP